MITYERIPFSPAESLEHEISYHNYHRNRMKFAFDLINKHKGDVNVEIGAWTLTYWMRYNKIPVHTVGFPEQRLINMRGENDMDYDYNLTKIRKVEAPINNADLVICCEVIEHLAFDMQTIFTFLGTMLKKGGRLIIQTPNGASLKNRLSLLFGKNPYQYIKDYPNGEYSHLREATLDELIAFASESGFTIIESHCNNYFNYSHSLKARLYEMIGMILPKKMHDGITMVLIKN
jgi:predicted SAM-dependent methyltransferase